jgi:outer membrane protein
MLLKRFPTAAAACILAWLVAGQGLALADTLESALASAYVNNPELNAERAGVRATDELVPQARAGQRPRVSATLDTGYNYRDAIVSPKIQVGKRKVRLPNSKVISESVPQGYAIDVEQNLFDGFRTKNQIRAAQSQVLGARETLRNTEQNVLLDAVVAYMNVLRDTAILNLRRNNIEVIGEQLRQTRDRFRVGEVTRTDVAQAESRLAFAQAQASASEAQLKSSLSDYIRVIGNEPAKLSPAKPVDKMLPRSRTLAIKISQSEHPAIMGSLHGVDAQLLSVRIAEADLYPRLDVAAQLAGRNDANGFDTYATSFSVVGRLTIPIYSGGGDYAQIRQEKERLGESRLQADVSRDRVRAAVAASWGQVEASRLQVKAAQAQVEAAESALSGVREEAKVGQRTTLDVLNAQQEVLDARVNLIVAQRDRVVASYNLLASVGRLNARVLRLKVPVYRPEIHYDQVKDKWFGTRTPAGE